MAQVLCMWASLSAAAVGVAPPAMMPPPVQPAAMSANAVASQLTGTNAGMVGMPASHVAPNVQFAPRVQAQSSWTGAEKAWMETLQSTPQTGADDMLRQQAPFRDGLETSGASFTDFAISFGGLLLAATAGAIGGAAAMSAIDQRSQTLQKKELATELTTAAPKFAVASLGSEPFDPLSLRAGPRGAAELREKEIKHGREVVLVMSNARRDAETKLEKHGGMTPAMAVAIFAANMPMPAEAFTEKTLNQFGQFFALFFAGFFFASFARMFSIGRL